MIISHNISALNTYRAVTQNNSQAAKSLEKLSSGLRINRAGDDAAGLAITEKMRGQIRGLGQAARNAQDAISMIQTAEGGASSIHNMLQRGRELAVQASNGTLTNNDRSSVQDEMNQIISQIDNVANNTEFNTLKMLNQTGTGATQFVGISQSALDQLTNKLPGLINDALVAIHNQLGIDYPDSPVNRPMTIEYYDDPADSAGASMGTVDGSSLTLRINIDKVFDVSGNLISEGVLDTLIAHEIVHAYEFTEMPFSITGGGQAQEYWFMEGLAMTIQGGSLFAATDHNVALVSPFDSDYRSAYEAVKVLHEITDGGISAFVDRLEAGDTLDQVFASTTQSIAGTELAASGTGFADFNTVNSFINWFNTDADGEILNYVNTSTDFTLGSGAITNGSVKGSSSNLTLDQTIANGTGTAEVNTYFTQNFSNASNATSNVVLQIGANAGQSVGLQTKDLRSSTLGLNGLSVATQSQANSAISTFDTAINTVSSARSYFGAMQNRLEHTIANLINTEENLTAAESRVRDVDMAKEMMIFQKNNILSQAAQAMLVQANQQPQGVLQLLR